MQEAQWCWFTVSKTVEIQSKLISFSAASGLDELCNRREACYDGANMFSIITELTRAWIQLSRTDGKSRNHWIKIQMAKLQVQPRIGPIG